jgi:O-antigen/teichoic acid export membrane protein
MRSLDVFRHGESLAHLLLRGSGTALIIMATGTVAAFLGRIVLARLLGVAAYGNYTYVLSWINGPLLVLALHGFETASLRFSAAYHRQSNWSRLRGFLQHSQRYVLASSLLIAAVLSLAVWLFRDNLTESLRVSFWVGALLVPANSLLFLISKQILSLKKVALGQSLYFLMRPGFLLIGVLFAFGLASLPRTAPAALLLLLPVTVGLLIPAAGYLRRLVLAAAKNVAPEYEKREWNRAGRELMMMAGFAMIVARADVLLLGALLGTAAAGIYGAAVTLVSLVNLGLVAINSVIAPMISELYVDSQLEKLQRLVTLVALGLSAYTILAAVLLLAFGKQILALFGPEFIVAYFPMNILILGRIANAAFGSVGFLLTMTGHERDAMYIFAAASVISVVLNLTLIPSYGLLGAAIATTIVTIIWNSLMFVRAKRLTGIDPTLFHGIKLKK